MNIRIQNISFTSSRKNAISTSNQSNPRISNTLAKDTVSFGAKIKPNEVSESTKRVFQDVETVYYRARQAVQKNVLEALSDSRKNGIEAFDMNFHMNLRSNNEVPLKISIPGGMSSPFTYVESLGKKVKNYSAIETFALRIGSYGNCERKSIIFSPSLDTMQVIDEKFTNKFFSNECAWKKINQRKEVTSMGIEGLNKEVQGYLSPIIEHFGKQFPDLMTKLIPKT